MSISVKKTPPPAPQKNPSRGCPELFGAKPEVPHPPSARNQLSRSKSVAFPVAPKLQFRDLRFTATSWEYAVCLPPLRTIEGSGKSRTPALRADHPGVSMVLL